MTHINFFKLQAKNLFRDYNTRFMDESVGIYDYKPRFFDVNSLVVEFDIDEENFSLMKAQHIIAYLAGFRKWTDLIRASESALELGRLLFDNRDEISIEDWQIYDQKNLRNFDDDSRLEVFKQVFLNISESNKITNDKKQTIADLEEMKKRKIHYEGATEESMKQMEKIFGANMFQNAYTHFLAYLEDLYISKSNGLERIKTELKVWDKKAQAAIINDLSKILKESGFTVKRLFDLLETQQHKITFKEFMQYLKKEVGDVDFTVEFAGFKDDEPYLDSKNPTNESMDNYYEMLEMFGAESVRVSISGKIFEGLDILDEPTEKIKHATKLIADWLSIKLG